MDEYQGVQLLYSMPTTIPNYHLEWLQYTKVLSITGHYLWGAPYSFSTGVLQDLENGERYYTRYRYSSLRFSYPPSTEGTLLYSIQIIVPVVLYHSAIIGHRVLSSVGPVLSWVGPPLLDLMSIMGPGRLVPVLHSWNPIPRSGLPIRRILRT